MKGIKFEKVSFGTFLKFFKCNDNMREYITNYRLAYKDNCEYKTDEELIKLLYDNIVMPKRKTAKSAGYDIYVPTPGAVIRAHKKLVLPTGLKIRMPDNVVLRIYPRSSTSSKNDIILSNMTGVIDADYYNNVDNEGHILLSLRNTSDNNIDYIISKEFDKTNMAQGIFDTYETEEDDNADGVRVGGWGSTN